MTNNTFEILKEIMTNAKEIDADRITLESRLIDDLGYDSIELYLMIDGICERFNIEISDDEVRSIATVEDAVKAIENSIK